jgi:hypothetical protein
MTKKLRKAMRQAERRARQVDPDKDKLTDVLLKQRAQSWQMERAVHNPNDPDWVRYREALKERHSR